ncbi:glycosyltransferase 87 family protein [Methylobacterium sp. P31]
MIVIRRLVTPLRQLAVLGATLAVIEVGALAIHVPGADTVGSIERANLFVAVVAAGLVPYLLAVRLTLREHLPGRALWLVLGLAVAMRAAVLPAPPFLSSDIYRYVWDGRVQAAGINPYRHIPADPALAALRDPTVYPLINRRDYARTIYPPAAQAVFAAVGRISDTVLAMKLATLAFEALGVLGLLGVLRIAGLPPGRILIYAWNPLALWSFACDGHVDALGIGLLGLALWLRARHRDSFAGAALAAAALVKVLPLAAAPAFVRGGSLMRPALVGLAVIALLYLPYLGAGRDVFGFLAGYGAEEGYDTGAGYWLLAGLGHLGVPPQRCACPTLRSRPRVSPRSGSGLPSGPIGAGRTPSRSAATPPCSPLSPPAPRARITRGTIPGSASRRSWRRCPPRSGWARRRYYS